MTVIRIVQLADGEELVSSEDVEPSSPLDDPRRDALERRSAATRNTRAREALDR